MLSPPAPVPLVKSPAWIMLSSEISERLTDAQVGDDTVNRRALVREGRIGARGEALFARRQRAEVLDGLHSLSWPAEHRSGRTLGTSSAKSSNTMLGESSATSLSGLGAPLRRVAADADVEKGPRVRHR